MSKKVKRVIFVDCFNTVIGRNATPDDVLFNMGEGLNCLYPEMGAAEFFKLFKACWKNLNKRAALLVEKSDFICNISEIFSDMADIISRYNLISNFNKDEFITSAQNVYFESEHNSHYVKNKTVKFLQKKKKAGHKIYMVSDFYCSKDVLIDWMKKLGIDVENLFDDVFVSCDEQKSKTTSSIYSALLKKLKLKGENVLMVGDNAFADKFPARKCKLKTKSVFPFIKRNSKKVRSLKSRLDIPSEYQTLFDEDLENGAYSNYAFPLYLFVRKLAYECKKRKLKNVFFLARDAWFIQKLFDIYCVENNIEVKSHYFVVSRKSSLNASLLDYSKAFAGLSDKPFVSVKNFLRTLEFSKEDIERIGKDAKINVNAFPINLSKTKAYKRLLANKLFTEIYNTRRQSQHFAFLNYLNSFGVDTKSQGFMFVDSGWYGNSSRYINNALAGEDVAVESYYIGCLNKNPVENKVYGLLFSNNNKHVWENSILYHRRLNYEQILRNGANSCIGYDTQTNLPVYQQGDKEKITYEQFIKQMQEKIMNKFLKIVELDKKIYCPFESVVTKLTYDIFKKSNKKDYEFFNNIQQTFQDNFAHVGYSYVHFAKWLRKLNFKVKDKWFLMKNKKQVNKKRLYFN